jgi:hypothetical protein
MTRAGTVLGVAGLFDEPRGLLRAAARVRKAGWRRWDCHTPYPVHGLDEAMGVRESFIPFVTISAGLVGAVAAKTMQWWMSDADFPLIVGGKPLFSLPAFVPVTFEVFVLFGALATFATVLISGRLLRWHSPLHEGGIMAEVMSDRFALFLDASDERFDEEAARRLLSDCGCEDVRTIREGEGG